MLSARDLTLRRGPLPLFEQEVAASDSALAACEAKPVP
jgi:hypothetical protein